MAQSQNKYSPVKEAIARLSHHMIEEDIRFGVSQKRVELVENCDGLATIEESYFTAILCHAFLEDLARRGKPTPFHEFIDTPSRPTEHALGSDISLGQYNSIFRIRIMHKVLRRHWCDQPWHEEYKFSAEGAKERTGDYGHLLTLLEVSVDHPNIVPYLAINVAFCVQDYRRMGFSDGKLIPFTIPGIDNLLQTLVIDLRCITEKRSWKKIVANDGFVFRIDKKSQEWDEDDFDETSKPFEAISKKATVSLSISWSEGGVTKTSSLDSAHVYTLPELMTKVASTFDANAILKKMAQDSGKTLHQFAEEHKALVLAREWDKLKAKFK